jgi:hypothetical protein
MMATTVPASSRLGALAEKWPDEATRALLPLRAVQDPHDEVRGSAFSFLGEMHSPFGRILPTRDLDGTWPYLDPLRPISRDHIEQAAKKMAIRPDDIDAQVASLSAHLGGDITRGAKASGQEKVGRKRTKKNANSTLERANANLVSSSFRWRTGRWKSATGGNAHDVRS